MASKKRGLDTKDWQDKASRAAGRSKPDPMKTKSGASYADRYKKRYYDTEDKVYKSMWQSAILGKSTTPGLGRKTKEEMRKTGGDMGAARAESRKRTNRATKSSKFSMKSKKSVSGMGAKPSRPQRGNSKAVAAPRYRRGK